MEQVRQAGIIVVISRATGWIFGAYGVATLIGSILLLLRSVPRGSANVLEAVGFVVVGLAMALGAFWVAALAFLFLPDIDSSPHDLLVRFGPFVKVIPLTDVEGVLDTRWPSFAKAVAVRRGLGVVGLLNRWFWTGSSTTGALAVLVRAENSKTLFDLASSRSSRE